jgi:hypothetical protein
LERHQLVVKRTPMLFGHLLLRSPQYVYDHPDWQMMRAKDITIDAALESFN